MYGLGMNNNGTGLVLAGAALAAHPQVLLPIIVYNLVQHLVAGAVGAILGDTPRTPPAGTPAYASDSAGRPIMAGARGAACTLRAGAVG
jgi:BASS family bile acid:Na+ symporter